MNFYAWEKKVFKEDSGTGRVWINITVQWLYEFNNHNVEAVDHLVSCRLMCFLTAKRTESERELFSLSFSAVDHAQSRSFSSPYRFLLLSHIKISSMFGTTEIRLCLLVSQQFYFPQFPWNNSNNNHRKKRQNNSNELIH